MLTVTPHMQVVGCGMWQVKMGRLCNYEYITIITEFERTIR